jgi:membrane-bound lytic murein transglycosylase B
MGSILGFDLANNKSETAANALASAANFLRANGWEVGTGYQPGETNFGAIQAWNAAPVYQRPISLIGQQN